VLLILDLGIHDAFELHGRPRVYNWDPREPISMMFGYPVGPHKDVGHHDKISRLISKCILQLLFLDREFAETMDPREDRTSAVRSQLLNILLSRMRGVAAGPDASPVADPSAGPSAGPQLPPLRFEPSAANTRPERHQLTPITERSHTAGTTIDNYPSHRSSTMQSTGADVLREGSRSSRHVGGPVLDRAINRSPSPLAALPAPDENSEQSGPTPRQSEERPVSRPDSKFSQVNEQPKTSFDSNAVNPANVSLPVSPPPESMRNVTPDLGVVKTPMGSPTTPSAQPPGGKAPASAPTSPNLPSPYSPVPPAQKDVMASSSKINLATPYSPVPQQTSFVTQAPAPATTVASLPQSPPQQQKDSGTQALSPLMTQNQKDLKASGLKISEVQPSAGPSSSAPSVDGSGGFTDDAGAALYYVQQYDDEKGQAEGSGSHLAPNKAAEYDDDDDTSPSEYDSPSKTQPVANPNGRPTVDNTAGRTPPPTEWQQTASTFASSELMPAESPINSQLGSRGALVGRKPSGARAPQKLSRQSFNGSLSSHQEETDDDEVRGKMSRQQSDTIPLPQRDHSVGPQNVDDNADALAALSFLDQEQQSLPSQKADERPKKTLYVESPSTRPVASAESQQYRSSFAPSKQVAERKARSQAQHEAQTAAAHKPGRANGKKKAKVGSAGAWNDSTDEEEEEEEEEEDTDDDADSDVEPSARGSKAGHDSSLGHPSSSQPQQAPRDSPAGSATEHNVYPQLRPVRTLPQVPTSRPSGKIDLVNADINF
jgi:CCR4-NOT transcriptional complex subunit CAF120